MKDCLQKQNLKKLINYRKLDFRRDNNLEFYFSDYRSLKELFKAIYYINLSIDKAERIQEEFESILAALEKCYPNLNTSLQKIIF